MRLLFLPIAFEIKLFGVVENKKERFNGTELNTDFDLNQPLTDEGRRWYSRWATSKFNDKELLQEEKK